MSDDIYKISQCLDFIRVTPEDSIKCPCSDDLTPVESVVEIPESSSEESINYTIPDINALIQLPLTDAQLNELEFGETLVVSYLEETDIEEIRYMHDDKTLDTNHDLLHESGGFCVNIERSLDIIIVYVTSQYSEPVGKSISNTIISIVDENLKLLEEKFTENVCYESTKIEKSIHIAAEKDSSKGLTIYRRETNGEGEMKKNRGTINANIIGSFITEGMNFLLMRHFAIQEFEGQIEAYGINVTGEIFRMMYSIHPHTPMIVNRVRSDVIRIKRTIFRQKEDPKVIIHYYLTTGHLLQIIYGKESKNLFMHVNPLSPIPPTGFIMNTHKHWMDDIELLSKYLDLKERRQLELKTYLKDRPDLKCFIKDYIMMLLQLKPTDVLNFTIEYFMSLGNCNSTSQMRL